MALAACGYQGTLSLNLAPGYSGAEVGEALSSCRARNGAKAVATVNPFTLPKRLWAAVVCGHPPQPLAAAAAGSKAAASATAAGGKAAAASGGGGGGGGGERLVSVDPTKRWDALSKDEMRSLEARVRRAALPFMGKDSNKDEFVTCGGVCWSGVDATRMESRHVANLYFAGELLDIDGVTGGHNFQSCWTTGFVAGGAAAEGAAASAAAVARGE